MLASVYTPDHPLVIQSVKYSRADGFDTLRFECENGETLSFGISPDQSCCESFGVRVFENGDSETAIDCVQEDIVRKSESESESESKKVDLDVYIGRTIRLVQYATIDDRYDRHMAAVDIFFTDDQKITVEVYNDHNGYYPHTYKITYGKWEDYDEL